jgi:LPXTG-site transpeptidase (sortase) family protein
MIGSIKDFRHIPRTYLILAAIALILLGAGSYQLWQRYRAENSPLNLGDPRAVLTVSTDDPGEAPVPVTTAYDVADSQPKIIRAPAIRMEGLIQKVGLDQEGKIAVPGNVNVAGWYVDRAKPGSKGLSIIDGHVSGKYTEGIFHDLGKLKPGDDLSVEYGNGQKHAFKVIDVREMPSADADKALFEQDPAVSSQLNLITCSGRFDRGANAYQNRTIVRAKAVD